MRYFVSFAYEGLGEQRFGNAVITLSSPIHSQEGIYAAEEAASLLMGGKMGGHMAVSRLSLLFIMPLEDQL